MKNIVLELIFLLSTFGYGLTFMMTRSKIASTMSSIRTSISMKAASPSLGGICYRVSNLQQSVKFYTSVFGMKVIEDSAKSTSVKLIMDSVADGESAMTIELLGGFADGSELGDVSILKT
jgi:Glyoxalase/Bleomycin resistance protein/Dioxygenase superfamily